MHSNKLIEASLNVPVRLEAVCLACGHRWHVKAKTRQPRCHKCWSNCVILLGELKTASRVMRVLYKLSRGKVVLPSPSDLFMLPAWPLALVTYDGVLKKAGRNPVTRLRALTLMLVEAGASDEEIVEFLEAHMDGYRVDAVEFLAEAKQSLSEAKKTTLALKSGSGGEK